MVVAPLALALACLLLQKVEWTRDAGRTLTVRLAQGNLPQFDKYTATGLRRALATYSTIAGSSSAQLTVFPETALPVEWFSLPPVILEGWKDLARERRSAIAIGAVVASPSSPEGGAMLTNSALVLLPDSTGRSYDYRYDKMHLLPVAELALPGGGWIYRQLGSHFSTMWPGTADQAPLALPGATVAFSICFESLFDTAMAAKAKTAEVLVNTSNFAWFDGSYAAAQHLQAGQMRARETGRWFLQAANSGQTAIVDQHGVVRHVLPAEVMGVLDGEVRLFDGQTPFMVLGNAPILAISGLLCCWLAWPAALARLRRAAGGSYPTAT
jgi:apolipoprotein N-acyltransferase